MAVRSDPQIRKAFAQGLAVCILGLVVLAVVVRVAGSGVHRPEGAAERWLAAVGDTTRKGVRAEARARAEKIGPLSVADPLLPTDTDGKTAFPDLEVGKAVVTGHTARVPYQLHQYATSGGNPVRRGVVVLARQGDGGQWRVQRLDDRRPGAGERVPSEGGDPPSSAPLGVWLAALAGGVVVTTGASLLVRWAGRAASSAEAEVTSTGAAAASAR